MIDMKYKSTVVFLSEFSVTLVKQKEKKKQKKIVHNIHLQNLK